MSQDSRIIHSIGIPACNKHNVPDDTWAPTFLSFKSQKTDRQFITLTVEVKLLNKPSLWF